MDRNAEELHRLWEEIRQGSTTSCSSLTTEKQSDTHSNLSTPLLISDLDLPSPLSAFSVEIEDIFNFELDEFLPPSPSGIQDTTCEAGFKPITPTGNHSENCAQVTTEDTTLDTTTYTEAGETQSKGLDTTPPTGQNSPESSPPYVAKPVTEEQIKDPKKRPLSPSVTHHGPEQKTRKIDRPPTPRPRRRESLQPGTKQKHYRPPPLLKLTVKLTPALAERLTKTGYLPLKKREYPRRFR